MVDLRKPPVKTLKSRGERLYQFPNHYFFVLKDGLFRKAGRFNWPSLVEDGTEPSPGLSLNKKLAARVLNDGFRTLIVYNKKRDVFYEMVNRRKAKKLLGRKGAGRADLRVMPISAFKTVSNVKLSRRLKKRI